MEQNVKNGFALNRKLKRNDRVTKEKVLLSKSMIKRLETEVEYEQAYDDADRKIKSYDMKKSLSRYASKLLFCIGLFASITSLVMSCLGISHTKSWVEFVDALQGNYWISILMVGVSQATLVIHNFYSYGICKYHKDRKLAFEIYRFVALFISLISNHFMVVDLIPEYKVLSTSNWLLYFIGWVFAFLPDLTQIVCSTTATQMKFKQYCYDNGLDTNAGLLKKLFMKRFGGLLLELQKDYDNSVDAFTEYYEQRKKEKQAKMPKNVENLSKPSVEKVLLAEERAVDRNEYDKNVLRAEPYDFNDMYYALKRNSELKEGDLLNRSRVGIDANDLDARNKWDRWRTYLVAKKLVKTVGNKSALTMDMCDVLYELEKVRANV